MTKDSSQGILHNKLLATKFIGSLWSHIWSTDSLHHFYAPPKYCLHVPENGTYVGPNVQIRG